MVESEETKKYKDLFSNNRISEEIINEKISDYKSINDIDNQIKVNEEKEASLSKEVKELNKQRNIDKTLCIMLGILICIGLALGVYGFIKQYMQIATGGTIFGIIIAICALLKINSYSRQNKKRIEKEEERKDIQEFVGKLKEKKYNLKMEVEAFTDLYSDIDQDDILMKLTEIKSEFNKYEGIMNNQNVLVQKQRDITEKLNELEESIKSYFRKYFSDTTQSYVAYAQ